MGANLTNEATPIVVMELKGLLLDRAGPEPLSKQLYLLLRAQILDGILKPRTKLPSSRAMARQLALGRNTVVAALDQLQAEGYLQVMVGAGSFVATEIPDHRGPQSSDFRPNNELPVFKSVHGENQGFCVGVPDLKAFPSKIWNRLSQQQSFAGLQNLMGFGDPEGYWPLRQAVCEYVRTSRAVRCRPEQVIITSGAQQGLELICRVLLQEGSTAALEEPGYRGMRKAVKASGKSMIQLPVDEDGVKLDSLAGSNVMPSLVYVTPANQYPLGVVLSLERKKTLLNWARENQGWVIEDDYDSEYHYHHRPLASLQGIDTSQRVVYVGSFSKVLFPALRLGYLILPESLVPQFVAAKRQSSGETPLHSQAVTAEFIQGGHFNRHLRKMRINYAEKLECLLNACESIKPWCKIHSHGAGLHVVLEFLINLDEQAVADALQEQGVQCSVLAQYFEKETNRQGLVLGFANSSGINITENIGRLKQIIKDFL